MLYRVIPGIVDELEAAISGLLNGRRWVKHHGILVRDWNPSQLRHGVSPVTNRTGKENGDDENKSQKATQGELKLWYESSLQEKYAGYEQCDDEAGEKYEKQNIHRPVLSSLWVMLRCFYIDRLIVVDS